MPRLSGLHRRWLLLVLPGIFGAIGASVSSARAQPWGGNGGNELLPTRPAHRQPHGQGPDGDTFVGTMPDAGDDTLQPQGGRPYPRLLGALSVGPPPWPAPAGYRYRCDDPSGYFPYINACRTQWRSVSVQRLR